MPTSDPHSKMMCKFRELLKLLNINLNHFPTHEKYALTTQIRECAYLIHGYIIEGEKRYQKKTTLTNLDIEHEKLRCMLSLAFELGYFEYHNSKHQRTEGNALKRYTSLSILVNELGAMIGGWIKHASK